ncbi:hypothetical protein [Sulfobacillus harzensis]|uniref:Uncharacterized protein n=1 Tax=Sulfobacillus harzensis TaxID=2729629 RepID=A0A7Y0L2R2_9FIRM|nr:hypothetical protein [Sulfobacillus harzensis]NMP22223.1 hypothetical protein [Sulfobacillus harzensis]
MYGHWEQVIVGTLLAIRDIVDEVTEAGRDREDAMQDVIELIENNPALLDALEEVS